MPHANQDAETERRIRKEALLLMAVWANLRQGVNRDALMEAIRRKDMYGAYSALGLDRISDAFGDVKVAIREAFERAAKKQADEIGLIWDPMAVGVMLAITQQTDELIRQITASTQGAIESAFINAIETERGTAEAADDIIAAIGLLPRQVAALDRYRAGLIEAARIKASRIEVLVDRYRARLLRQRADAIARTSIIDAEAAGRDEVWRAAVAAGIMTPEQRVEWVTTSGNPCQLCLEMEGNTRAVGGTYAPGLPSSGPPTLHVNCFIGSTIVQARDIVAVTKRFYEGPVITIESALGHKITCTPNHPIMTGFGWLPAGSLDEGFEILCDGSVNLLIQDNNNGNVPTRIEDIAEAFTESIMTFSEAVKVSPENFDGDGEGSKIAVILTNWELGHGGDLKGSQHVAQDDLVFAGSKSSSEAHCGTPDFGFHTMLATPDSIVGGDSISGPLLGGQSAHADFLGTTETADGNSIFLKDSADCSPSYPKSVGDELFALVSGVEGNDFGFWKNRGGSSLTDRDVIDTQNGTNRQIANAQSLADLNAAFPGKVQADNIVSVKSGYFRGHVFNLQTVSGWYLADSIIAHNCQCVEYPVSVGKSMKLSELA